MLSVSGTLSLDGQISQTGNPEAFERWLGTIRKLSDTELEQFAAVLGATDSTDALRRLFGLLPALASPGPALAKALGELGRDEWTKFAFQLATARALLAGEAPDPLTLDRYAFNLLSNGRLVNVRDVGLAILDGDRDTQSWPEYFSELTDYTHDRVPEPFAEQGDKTPPV